MGQSRKHMGSAVVEHLDIHWLIPCRQGLLQPGRGQGLMHLLSLSVHNGHRKLGVITARKHDMSGSRLAAGCLLQPGSNSQQWPPWLPRAPVSPCSRWQVSRNAPHLSLLRMAATRLPFSMPGWLILYNRMQQRCVTHSAHPGGRLDRT